MLLFYRLGDVPPGLHVDAAIDALDAQRVLSGQLVAFFETNNGREPLYMYYLAALMGLAGAHRLVYDFAAAAMGMLTVALTYRLAKAMFGPAAAAAAGAFLGTSFWFLYVDRIGQRITMLAPATAAFVYFLWRTLRHGRKRDAILAGASLGLGLYTYQPARFLPLLGLLLCLADLQAARKRASCVAIAAATAAAIFLPQGLYLATHPAVALQRTGQVSVLSSDLRGLAESTLRTGGMFFVQGDWRPWQNLPFRPVFDPVLAVCFGVGLVVALVRCRGGVRYRWLLLWLFTMALPGMLTTGAPSQFRLLGSMPVAFVFPALALVAFARQLGSARAWVAVAAMLIVWQGASTFHNYFQRWATSPEALQAFDSHENAMVQQAEANRGLPTYFSDIRTLAGQPVRALLPAAQRQPWYPEDGAVIPLSLAGPDTLYIGSPRSSIGTLAPAWLPGIRLLRSSTPDSHDSAWAFRWPAAERDAFLRSLTPLDVTFGSEMRLTAYAVHSQAGGVTLDLVWQQVKPSGPYDLYTHVLDGSRNQVAQGDTLFFPLERLGLAEHFGQGQPTDDLLLTRHTYALRPGRYVVEVGVVHRDPTDPGRLLEPVGAVARLELEF